MFSLCMAVGSSRSWISVAIGSILLLEIMLSGRISELNLSVAVLDMFDWLVCLGTVQSLQELPRLDPRDGAVITAWIEINQLYKILVYDKIKVRKWGTWGRFIFL